ncbi:MAG: hypothetical protein ACP5KE_06665 [Candidatus Methanodesulfokora sp.]|jgi:DNA-binding transcriptional regulator YhcF (GntR family)
MGKVSVSGYEYIAKKVAEVVVREAEIQGTTLVSIDEVAGELRTTPYKIVKAWSMFGDNYPHIMYSPGDRCFFVKRGKSLAYAKVGREVPDLLDEEEAEKREESLLIELEGLGVDMNKVKKEAEERAEEIVRGDRMNEKKEEEKAGEKGEIDAWSISDEEIKRMEERKFEENFPNAMKELARRGPLDITEISVITGISPSSFTRFWKERGGNEFVEIKDNRLVPNTYAAFSLINKVIDILLDKKLVPARDMASILHTKEKTLRDAWELVGSLIPYARLEGETFKLVGEKK